MLAIYKKELRTYFNSIIGWLFISFFLAFIGIYFFLNNLYYGYTHIGYSLYSVGLIFISEINGQSPDPMVFSSLSATKTD